MEEPLLARAWGEVNEVVYCFGHPVYHALPGAFRRDIHPRSYPAQWLLLALYNSHTLGRSHQASVVDDP